MPAQIKHRIQQIDEAVAEVFDQMLGKACVPELPTTDQTVFTFAKRGVTALVHFSGPLNGTCTVHLDLNTAGELTASLTGEDYRPTAPAHLSADMVGELCNMIAGSWKSRLSSEQATCGLSSPTIRSETPMLVVGDRKQEFSRSLVRIYRFDNRSLILNMRFD